jgi:RimJ/RimL family protein N-acetyltransferase
MSASAPIANGDSRIYANLPRYFRWFTEHCVLRQLDGADVPRIWRAVVQPLFAECWSGQAPRSEREVKELVRSAMAAWSQGSAFSMAAVKRQSHEFVGFIGMHAVGDTRTVWTVDFFIHPNFMTSPNAIEAIMAAADLTFAALGAQKVYSGCPAGHEVFEQLLYDAGFIEAIPAGSLDHQTQQPRQCSLFEMCRDDWKAIRREYSDHTGTPSLASLGTALTKPSALELL